MYLSLAASVFAVLAETPFQQFCACDPTFVRQLVEGVTGASSAVDAKARTTVRFGAQSTLRQSLSQNKLSLAPPGMARPSLAPDFVAQARTEFAERKSMQFDHLFLGEEETKKLMSLDSLLADQDKTQLERMFSSSSTVQVKAATPLSPYERRFKGIFALAQLQKTTERESRLPALLSTDPAFRFNFEDYFRQHCQRHR